MTVTVYSKENCPACRQTKRFLDREGIPYKEVHLAQVPELVEQFKANGFMSAPVVVTPHQTWCGFRLDQLKGLSRTYMNSDRSSCLDSVIQSAQAAKETIRKDTTMGLLHPSKEGQDR